ncbi:MAG: hypothetical protein IT260_24615 [Saprospiraceae bacterium]|nr:hypothetical protein [Saprospiraceae bacterium]
MKAIHVFIVSAFLFILSCTQQSNTNKRSGPLLEFDKSKMALTEDKLFVDSTIFAALPKFPNAKKFCVCTCESGNGKKKELIFNPDSYGTCPASGDECQFRDDSRNDRPYINGKFTSGCREVTIEITKGNVYIDGRIDVKDRN